MIIEILYSDLYLFGERGNAEYLEKVFDKATIHWTQLGQTPAFVQQNVDFIYMGAMKERDLNVVYKELVPYKERLSELIENNTVFLVTNSALDIFGQGIESKEGNLPALGILPFKVERHPDTFTYSAILANFKGMKVMGYEGRFTEQVLNEDQAWFTLDFGHGATKTARFEGVHYKNFHGTQMMGPLLILNPPLMRYFQELVGETGPLPFEQHVEAAYQNRLHIFQTEAEFKAQH